jgi:hypothetical protein
MSVDNQDNQENDYEYDSDETVVVDQYFSQSQSDQHSSSISSSPIISRFQSPISSPLLSFHSPIRSRNILLNSSPTRIQSSVSIVRRNSEASPSRNRSVQVLQRTVIIIGNFTLISSRS